MRLMVRRVKVLAIPATREVDLSTNSVGASHRRKGIIPDRHSVEVEAKESNRLLGKAASIIGTERIITA